MLGIGRGEAGEMKGEGGGVGGVGILGGEDRRGGGLAWIVRYLMEQCAQLDILDSCVLGRTGCTRC